MKLKKFLRATAAIVGLCGSVNPALATGQTESIASKFAAPESVRSISISPDGNQIVFVAARPGGGENAIVIDLATGGALPIFSSQGIEEQISYCIFVLNDRVVCQAYFRQGSSRNTEGATRLVSLSSDGKHMEMLSAKTANTAYYSSNYGGRIVDYNSADSNSVLMTTWKPEEVSTGTLTARRGSGLLVEQVDLVKGKRKQIIAPNPIAYSYISDGQGHIRIMAAQPRSEYGYAKTKLEFSYRGIDENGWHELGNVSVSGGTYSGFEPVAVDSDKNVVFGFETQGNYQGLYQIALDGSLAKTPIMVSDAADIDSLIRIGRKRRVIGATYATDYRHVEYFDPRYEKLSNDLGRALGGRQVAIIDADAKEEKMLLFVASDVDPGTYYYFDSTTSQVSPIFAARPQLDGMQFGEMKPVRYPAADGTMIPGYLTLPPGSDGKNLPAIVMPHGGPSSRDEWGFDWLVQYFVSQGFAVLQPNYRGSSGLGANWFQKNGFQSWRTAIGDIDDAARWLEKQGIAAPGKLAIFGWSYGGYAALQSAVTEPGLFKAVVAVAPVTDLEKLVQESRNDVDYNLVADFVGRGPHVEEGSPAQHADRISVPVLLVHGDADTNVLVGHSRLMKDRLEAAGKQVQYIEFERLAHSLVDQTARTKMLGTSSAFIRKALDLPE